MDDLTDYDLYIAHIRAAWDCHEKARAWRIKSRSYPFSIDEPIHNPPRGSNHFNAMMCERSAQYFDREKQQHVELARKYGTVNL